MSDDVRDFCSFQLTLTLKVLVPYPIFVSVCSPRPECPRFLSDARGTIEISRIVSLYWRTEIIDLINFHLVCDCVHRKLNFISFNLSSAARNRLCVYNIYRYFIKCYIPWTTLIPAHVGGASCVCNRKKKKGRRWRMSGDRMDGCCTGRSDGLGGDKIFEKRRIENCKRNIRWAYRLTWTRGRTRNFEQ